MCGRKPTGRADAGRDADRRAGGPVGHQEPEVGRGAVGLAGARGGRDRAGGRQARVVRPDVGRSRASGRCQRRPGGRDPGPTHESLREAVMIGGAQTIGTQRISRYLAKFDKNELTADTPYGVLTRRLTVKVDDTDVEVTIIDPFAALWLITSARGKISSSLGGVDCLPYIPTRHIRHNPSCPALGIEVGRLASRVLKTRWSPLNRHV